MSAPHPATPLIVEAEAIPGFHFETERVEKLLAVASQLAPATLPPAWIVRLAHRYADVLIQQGALDRAAIWLGTAGKHLGDDPAPRVEHGALEARLATRRGDEPAATRALRSAERALEDRAESHARLSIAHAELHTRRGAWGAVVPLLEAELDRAGAFDRLDDLWRAERLLAFACRNRLDFARAAELYHAIADLAALHDAPRDRAEALVGLGQSLIALGRGDEAMAALTTAQALAPGDTLTWKDATAAVVAGHLATGDADAALTTARDAAIALAGRDDARGYLEAVGLVVHLHRIRGEHAIAYRTLLGIHGLVQQRFGEAATAPIKALIDQLAADLGPEKFEAMAQALLAELQAGQVG